MFRNPRVLTLGIKSDEILGHQPETDADRQPYQDSNEDRMEEGAAGPQNDDVVETPQSGQDDPNTGSTHQRSSGQNVDEVRKRILRAKHLKFIVTLHCIPICVPLCIKIVFQLSFENFALNCSGSLLSKDSLLISSSDSSLILNAQCLKQANRQQGVQRGKPDSKTKTSSWTNSLYGSSEGAEESTQSGSFSTSRKKQTVNSQPRRRNESDIDSKNFYDSLRYGEDSEPNDVVSVFRVRIFGGNE